ncbi:MAG: rhamnulokinase family protein, partial [Planctomycetota bacterium]
MATFAHLAIDLGAESGRVMVGVFTEVGLQLEEAHRFQHIPVDTPNGLCWDITGLWREICEGLRASAKLCESHDWTPVSVGADTWGVDFALTGRSGVMLGLPSCYRNPSFAEAMERVHERVSEPEVYAETGIQSMPFNSLYQLDERLRSTPEAVNAAHRLLFMPDLIHWLLSGVMKIERTIASTSQMLDAGTGTWNTELLRRLGLPDSILAEPVDPGSEIGTLRGSLAESTGLPVTLKIIAPASHDTASAVAAVPYTQREGSAYLSSGTWSLLGVELDNALISNASNAHGFTNELGLDGRVRFLKNIAGLWLVQQSRAQLREDGLTDEQANYAALTQAASEAEPLRSVFPANHPSLAAPGKMVDRIRTLCAECNEPEPKTPGQIIRACLDSLALEYRATVHNLKVITGTKIRTLHIVGGGGQNRLLNQLTADATRKHVVVGPFEASSAGNLLVQAQSCGTVPSNTNTADLLGSHLVDIDIKPDIST